MSGTLVPASARCAPLLSTTLVSTASAFALVALSLPVLGCGGGEKQAAPKGPDAVYEVRGEIARLPDPSSPDIWIRHESIPGFRNATGDIVGMDSMTMPFGVGDDSALDQLAVGDRIAFRLEIDWEANGSPSQVVDVHKLEPGTRLEFDPPLDDAGDQSGAGDAEAPADDSTPK